MFKFYHWTTSLTTEHFCDVSYQTDSSNYTVHFSGVNAARKRHLCWAGNCFHIHGLMKNVFHIFPFYAEITLSVAAPPPKTTQSHILCICNACKRQPQVNGNNNVKGAHTPGPTDIFAAPLNRWVWVCIGPIWTGSRRAAKMFAAKQKRQFDMKRANWCIIISM